MTDAPMVRRLMVADRGVAALRVGRTARQMGAEVVVCVRDEDAGSRWPDRADYAARLPVGEDQPWPPVVPLVEAVLDAGCDTVHPGWGPVARRADLAQRLEATGIRCAGPGTTQLAAVADRLVLGRLAEQLEVGVVPASDPIDDPALAETWLTWTGLPAIVKPADAATGPRGVRVDTMDEGRAVVETLLPRGRVLLERFVVGAREVEVPFVGEGDGSVVVLGDCDIGVRVGGPRTLTEAPAADIDRACRQRIYTWTTLLASRLRWRGLGAARFLVTPDGRPYFLQLRPGLQPWHAAVEAAIGADLVDVQLRLAAGDALGWTDPTIRIEGSAFSVRLVARGGSGRLVRLRPPSTGRWDPGPEEGDAVLDGDDVGVLTVRAPTRQAAIVLLKKALDDLVVEGVDVALAPLRHLLAHPEFWKGPPDRDSVDALVGGVDGRGARG